MIFSKVHNTWEIGYFMLVLHKCVKMKPLIRLRLIWTKKPIKKHVRNHGHLIQPSQKKIHCDMDSWEMFFSPKISPL